MGIRVDPNTGEIIQSKSVKVDPNTGDIIGGGPKGLYGPPNPENLLRGEMFKQMAQQVPPAPAASTGVDVPFQQDQAPFENYRLFNEGPDVRPTPPMLNNPLNIRPEQPTIQAGEHKTNANDIVEGLKAFIGGGAGALTLGGMNYSQDYPDAPKTPAAIGQFAGDLALLMGGEKLIPEAVNTLTNNAVLNRLVKDIMLGGAYGAAQQGVNVAKGGEFNPGEIASQAGQFGLYGGALEGLGQGFKALRGGKPGQIARETVTKELPDFIKNAPEPKVSKKGQTEPLGSMIRRRQKELNNRSTNITKPGNNLQTELQNAKVTQESPNVTKQPESKIKQPWETVRNSVEQSVKKRFVRGDRLLNTMDLADELASKNAEISPDGMVTLYHRTTPQNAKLIVNSGKMVGKEDRLFFGTHPEGQIEGYGDAVVKVKLPLEKLELNDIFSKEAHVTLKGSNANIKAEIWSKPAKMSTKPVEPVTSKVESKQIEPKVTGLKKAEIERTREELGLDKMEPAKRERWVKVFKRAQENNLSENALQKANEVISTKRTLNRHEFAGMVIKKAKLENEYQGAVEAASNAVEKGNTAQHKFEWERAQAIRKDIDKLLEASEYAGRETARDLNFRKILVNRDDYSLAKITQQAQALKGRKLTFEETTRYKKLADDYADVQKRLAEAESKNAELLAKQEKMKAERILKVKARKESITSNIKAKKAEIVKERADIKKQLADLGFRVNDVTGVTAEGSYLIGKLALNYAKEGAVSMEGVIKQVMADIPDITESDVIKSILTRDPNRIGKIRSETAKRVSLLKRQAKILAELESEKGVPSVSRQMLNELTDLAYKNMPTDAKLERTLKVIDDLREQIKTETDPAVINEKIKELRRVMRAEYTLKDLQNQLKTGEFKVKPKTERKIPPEVEKLQIEARVARKRINGAIEDAAPMTFKRVVNEGINLARTLKATADMSATLRQGLILSTQHPVLAAKAFGKAVKATFSETQFEQIDNALRNRPAYYLGERAGLHLTELGAKITAREEMFMSRLAESIPGYNKVIKASERHMTTHLNVLRSSVFDDFVKRYPNATREELKAWATWVNVATGRGDLGASMYGQLSKVLFAPRFTMSRIQTPYEVFRHWKYPRVRNEIAKNYASLTITGMTALGLAKLAGADVQLNDPRSADWGKIRVGNTRYDIWGGLQQPARVVARIILSGTDANGWTGEDYKNLYRDQNVLELLYSFSKYKLAPHLTIPYELVYHKDIVGEPMTPTETAIGSVMPLVVQSIIQAAKDDQSIPVGAFEFMGGGASTYPDSKTATIVKLRKLKDAGKMKEYKDLMRSWNLAHPKSHITNP